MLSSLSISPTSVSIAHGLSHTFTVAGTLTDGSPARTFTLAWTSSDPTVATIAGGTVTTHATGTTTITVRCTVTGKTANATLNVTAPVVSRITMTPTGSNTSVGLQQQFTATAIYTNSATADVTSTATWHSSNPSFASLDPNTAGLVHAIAPGQSTITATFDNVTGSAEIIVASGGDVVTYLYALGWSEADSTYYLKAFNVSTDASMVETASFAVEPQTAKMATDGSRFLYIDADSTGTIKSFKIDRYTGVLTPGPSFKPTSGSLSHITVDPMGKWLIGFDQNASPATVRVFSIDYATGDLADTGYSYPVGTAAAVPNGQHVTTFVSYASGTYFYYGAGSGSCSTYGGSGPCKSLFGFRLDPNTGALAALNGSPFDSWSPQTFAMTKTLDQTALFLSLDAYRIITFSLDPLTGVPTETSRWFPFGWGSPIQRLVPRGNGYFAPQSRNLLEIIPDSINKLTSVTVMGLDVGYYPTDIAIGNHGDMLFATYGSGVKSYTLDAIGNPIERSSVTLAPSMGQIIAIDRMQNY